MTKDGLKKKFNLTEVSKLWFVLEYFDPKKGRWLTQFWDLSSKMGVEYVAL